MSKMTVTQRASPTALHDTHAARRKHMRRWATCKTCQYGIVRQRGWRRLFLWEHESWTPAWVHLHKARPRKL